MSLIRILRFVGQVFVNMNSTHPFKIYQRTTRVFCNSVWLGSKHVTSATKRCELGLSISAQCQRKTIYARPSYLYNGNLYTDYSHHAQCPRLCRLWPPYCKPQPSQTMYVGPTLTQRRHCRPDVEPTLVQPTLLSVLHWPIDVFPAPSHPSQILGRELGPSGVSPHQRSRWKHAFSPLKHV